MIKKITQSIQTNEIGQANKIIHLRGRIEKICIAHSIAEQQQEHAVQILMETSESEKVLELSGTKNATYYPRTPTHNIAGVANTFDGSNPVVEKYYVHEFLRVMVHSPEPNRLIHAISIYFDEDANI